MFNYLLIENIEIFKTVILDINITRMSFNTCAYKLEQC